MAQTGLTRPTLDEIKARILSDANTILPDADAGLRYTVFNRLLGAVTGASNELHGRIDTASDDTNVLYATGDALDVWGQTWGVQRKAQAYAVGQLILTVTTSSTVPTGTLFTRTDSTQFITTSAVTLSTGTQLLTVQALNAGLLGNTDVNTKFSINNPISGINAQCIASSTPPSGGLDLEDDESYRDRILARINQAPSGGNANDYKTWALSIPGIAKAKTIPLARGYNSVDVRILLANNGVPNAGQISTVQNYINTVKPITADVLVAAPFTSAVNIILTNLLPNTSASRLAAKAQLQDLFLNLNIGDTLYVSKIYDTVLNSSQVNSFTLSSPSTDIDTTDATLLTLGTVTINGVVT